MARQYTRDGVNFNVEKLKEAIEASGIPATKLSSMVLNRGTAYISNTCDVKGGRMGREDLERLCKFLDISFDALVIKDEPKPVEKVDAPVDKAKAEQLDTLVVGLNVIFEEFQKLNALMDTLAREQKVTNTVLSRMEQRLGSIDNSNGQILAKAIKSNDNEEEISEAVGKIKSGISIIQGRTKDILESVEDDRKKFRAVK